MTAVTRVARGLVERDRMLAIRVSSIELARLHAAAKFAGITLSDLVREGTRAYARELERERREAAAE